MTEPLFKSNVAECQCGCGQYGTQRRPNRDGSICVRSCKCKRCQGRENRKSGLKAQAKATSAVGIKRSSLKPGNEEHLSGALRVEVKSGLEAARVLTAYLNAKAQSDAARSIGDLRPFVALYTDGRKVIAAIDVNHLADVLVAYADGAA